MFGNLNSSIVFDRLGISLIDLKAAMESAQANIKKLEHDLGTMRFVHKVHIRPSAADVGLIR